MPVALSVLLMLVVAVIGFAATGAASNRAQAVHIADRSQEEKTLTSLGTEYVLFGFKEEINFATSHSWSLQPGDPNDVAQLKEYTGQSALLGYGAALMDLSSGEYLSSSAEAPGLPQASDPGMAPLITALRHGAPALSLVMHVGSVPLVSYGVTLTVGDTTVGFLGFSRLDQSPLETSVMNLHFGKSGVAYVLDSHGVAVASSDPALVGKPLASIPPLVELAKGKSGFDEYGSGNDRQIATFGTIGFGWSGLTTESASEFFGPIRSGILLVEEALILFLLVAAGLITVFIHRRHVTLRREMYIATELAEARERFRHAFEETPVGMALIDIQPESRGRFLQVNRALCHMTGLSQEELLERGFNDLVHPDNTDEMRISAERLFSDNLSFEIEARLATSSGTWKWTQLHGSLVRDAVGHPLYGVAHIEDISARKVAEQRLAHMALHDPLTGLANRVLVADRLSRALKVASRYENHVGVLYLDLDNFKEINDTFGHEMGDRVLKKVAERLQKAVRPEDTAGRLGGDEFVIVCVGLSEPAEVLTVAERIERAVSATIEIDGISVSIKASTGISIGGDADTYADQLLRDADAAMYLAKRNGRGRVQFAEMT